VKCPDGHISSSIDPSTCDICAAGAEANIECKDSSSKNARIKMLKLC